MLKVQLRPSSINHPSAGLGLFADADFDKGRTIGYYYGALVYGDIGSDRRETKLYGEGVLACSSNDFDKWSAHINYKFVSREGEVYTAYICPAPWCVVRYINDPRYQKMTEPTSMKKL